VLVVVKLDGLADGRVFFGRLEEGELRRGVRVGLAADGLDDGGRFDALVDV
jgi:hypothetical protein